MVVCKVIIICACMQVGYVHCIFENSIASKNSLLMCRDGPDTPISLNYPELPLTSIYRLITYSMNISLDNRTSK